VAPENEAGQKDCVIATGTTSNPNTTGPSTCTQPDATEGSGDGQLAFAASEMAYGAQAGLAQLVPQLGTPTEVSESIIHAMNLLQASLNAKLDDGLVE